ncbi:unnamed protein product [Phytophthora fragariaefolia]|uniref:Unnamed protein product n=1 Tax=Phytophthora fragariaefolia TaxID=1490495 RepID=A0A9W6XDH6_9STRA|nr:unnamed protein product [Phytophthora fragariaefolia]
MPRPHAEILASMLKDASAETSERVIAVLGSRLEAMTRLVVGLHLEPSIRGDRRVRSKMEPDKCLDDVISALIPDSRVGADNPLDVVILRAQVYAAETAQASAERELAKETFRRENAAAVTSSTTKDLAETLRQLQISRDITARYQHDASALNTVLEQHKELYQRMENQVKATEDSVQRLTSQLTREREVFKAAVAANTAQSRRLYNLLSSSGAADVSTKTYLRRRNEDLQERVKRLIAANRTLRARVNLEELDPDTSVLVAEGDSSLVVAACLDCFSDLSCFLLGLSTGELGWGLLNLSDETRVVVRDALKAADVSRSVDEIVDSVARAAFQVSTLPSEMSPKTQAAETRRTSPGTSLAEVREATSKRKALSSFAAPARKRLRGSESDSGDHTASSDTSTLQRRKIAARPASTPVASKSRSLSLSRSSSKAPSPPPKQSSPRSRRASAACSRATSRAVARTSSPVRGGVTASSPVDSRASASLAPPVTTASFGAPDATAAGGVSPSHLTTSLQEAQATLASQSFRSALSCDESVATIVLSDGEAEVEDQPKSAAVASSVPCTRPAVSSGSASTVDLSSWFRSPLESSSLGVQVSAAAPLVVSETFSYNSVPFFDRSEAETNIASRRQAFVDAWRGSGFSASASGSSSIRGPASHRARVEAGGQVGSTFRLAWISSARGIEVLDEDSQLSSAASLGFALWERDHWIPARAVELYFEVAYRTLKESFDEASRPSLQVSVDAAKDRWMAYVRERTQRSDRLRQKLVCTLWEWCRSDRFPDVDIELMFEPSMPGFSLEPLAWTPRTTDLLSELPALEGKEPWRSGWVDVPSPHPYNTTFVPRNPSFPLFVPVGYSRDMVHDQVVLDPSLDPHEISTSWLQVPSVPSLPDESASDVSLLPTGPVRSSLPAPASDVQLQLLVQATAADSDGVTEI